MFLVTCRRRSIILMQKKNRFLSLSLALALSLALTLPTLFLLFLVSLYIYQLPPLSREMNIYPLFIINLIKSIVHCQILFNLPDLYIHGIEPIIERVWKIGYLRIYRVNAYKPRFIDSPFMGSGGRKGLSLYQRESFFKDEARRLDA